MKKLMIAAAAAAMVGGVYAALPTENDTIIETDAGSMYNVQMTVKTLIPTVYSSLKTTGCAICPGIAGDVCYLFEQGTLKVNGIFASCGCEDPFKYGYFWLNSGKKAIPLFDKLSQDTIVYTDLPEVATLGLTFTAMRYSKTNKKVAAGFTFNNADAELYAMGFGSYTEAKYSYSKADDEYTLKTPAKISVSGSVVGGVAVERLVALQEIEVDADNFLLFPIEDACTVSVDCHDGSDYEKVYLNGTFSVKPMTVKALAKAIPANCWE